MTTTEASTARTTSRSFLVAVGVLIGAVIAGGVFDMLTGTPGTVMSSLIETVQQLIPGAVGGEQISDAIVSR